MKKSTLLYLISALAFLSSCQPKVAPFEIDAKKDLINETNQHITMAIANKNADSVANFHANEGMICPPGESCIKGTKGISEWYKNSFDYGLSGIEYTITDLSGDENHLIECGKAVVSIKTSDVDTLTKDYFKYLKVWVKKNDSTYVIQAQMWNADSGK